MRAKLPKITKEENEMLEQMPLESTEKSIPVDCEVTRNYMDIHSPRGTKVKFIETNKESVNWGANDDPEPFLIRGEIYTVERTEVHSWHTKVILQEHPKLKFNSSHFDSV